MRTCQKHSHKGQKQDDKVIHYHPNYLFNIVLGILARVNRPLGEKKIGGIKIRMGKTKLLLFADYKTVHKGKKKREKSIINKQKEFQGFGAR